MFAKTVVFFLTLVTFVNTAPVVDYTTNPGVRPIKVTLPDGEHKIQPVGSVTSKREPSLDIGVSGSVPRAGLVGLGLAFDTDIAVAPALRKRETVDLNTISNQILNGLKSNGLDEYVEDFSTRIQRLKDLLASNVSPALIAAEANLLLLEYRQVLAGLNVNKPVETRDIVIDGQVLAQLRSFVNSTVNLLSALGKSDAVQNFLAKINKLKAEAQNGTLDAGDLLNAARDIVLSIL